jgi:hypothetical protein
MRPKDLYVEEMMADMEADGYAEWLDEVSPWPPSDEECEQIAAALDGDEQLPF